MIAAELSVVGGKHTGQVIPLNRRKFLIGREQDCQLRPNSEMVSRHHCIFSIDDFAVRLRDLGSTNGTFVNGKRIQKETIMASGDHVVIGNLEFRFSIAAGKSIDPSSSSEFNLSGKPEDTQVSSQTLMEMPAAVPGVAVPQAAAAPAPAEVQAATQPPSAPATDTVVMPPGQMMPPQYGYPPQMMQPMGFPGGMYGGYPYQHVMPGYGQMYPPMMGQPMSGFPMPGMPEAPATPSPTTQPQAAIALPDPASTGARTEAPKGSSGTKDPEKPTGAADAILKQYNGRRPSP